MSDTERNKAILRQAVEAWSECRGTDPTCWMSAVHDDVQFFSLAAGAHGLGFTAPGRGKDHLQVYFDGLIGGLEMERFEIDTYIAEGDRVVGVGSCAWRVKGTGTPFQTPIVLVTRFSDGKIVEISEYYDTATVSAAPAAVG